MSWAHSDVMAMEGKGTCSYGTLDNGNVVKSSVGVMLTHTRQSPALDGRMSSAVATLPSTGAPKGEDSLPSCKMT